MKYTHGYATRTRTRKKQQLSHEIWENISWYAYRVILLYEYEVLNKYI